MCVLLWMVNRGMPLAASSLLLRSGLMGLESWKLLRISIVDLLCTLRSSRSGKGDYLLRYREIVSLEGTVNYFVFQETFAKSRSGFDGDLCLCLHRLSCRRRKDAKTIPPTVMSSADFSDAMKYKQHRTDCLYTVKLIK
ncbi:hypothetical protein BKA65DRAFT_501759 [Rhexocercosporidium sp. MPI-PUGE-AT-0058]|nr:hypothetical protein BKA65DRAFT_501759 [Rhexocercosporidium sp. MPI-PUGE-AT-0058]